MAFDWDRKAELFPRLIFINLSALAACMAFSIAYTNVFLSFCLLLALVDRLTRNVHGWKRTPIDESLGILIAITFLSSIFGMHSLKSLWGLRGLWVFFIFYLFVWYGSPHGKMKIFVNLLLGVGGIVSLYAILQHYTGISLLDEQLRTTSSFSGAAIRYISQGTFSHHQTFANIYFMIFCLSFSLAFIPASLWRRVTAAVMSVVLVLAVIFSYTRGIWLATLVAVLFISLFKSRKTFGIVVLILAIIWGGMARLPSTYSSRARTIFTFSGNIDRLIIWEASWAMLREYPLLGIGFGNYRELQEEYFPPGTGMEVSRTHAHNTYLQLAVERGLFAVVAFVWIWYVVLRIGFSSLWFLRGQEGFRLAAIRGATAGVVGFLIDGFFQNNFGDSEVLALLLFLVAMIVKLRVKQTERETGITTDGGEYAAA